MAPPERIQPRRVKDWRLPKNTLAAGPPLLAARGLPDDLEQAVPRAKELNDRLAAWHQSADGGPAQVVEGAGSVKPDSVAHVIRLYKASPWYKKLKPKTQHEYGPARHRRHQPGSCRQQIPGICAISGHSERAASDILKHDHDPTCEMADDAIRKLVAYEDAQAQREQKSATEGEQNG